MNLLRGQEFFDDYGYPAALVFFGAAFGSLVGGVAYRSRRPPVLTPIPPAAIVDIPEDGSGRP
jgi:hypothetical protein